MDLKEIMEEKTFVVLGNTIDEDKYAYKIKNKLIEKNYNVYAVSKELESINEVDADDFILDLCINPIKGLEYLKESKKKIKAVLIQPGAISDDIINFLNEKKIPYLEGCALVGVSLYKK